MLRLFEPQCVNEDKEHEADNMLTPYSVTKLGHFWCMQCLMSVYRHKAKFCTNVLNWFYNFLWSYDKNLSNFNQYNRFEIHTKRLGPGANNFSDLLLCSDGVHHSDVTWAALWSLKPTATWLFVHQYVLAIAKETSVHCWPFVSGIIGNWWIPLRKGQ